MKSNYRRTQRVVEPSTGRPFIKKPAMQSATGWDSKAGLFSSLNHSEKQALEELPGILEEVWPLKKKHLEKLPEAIANLSRQMTLYRNELGKNYWSKPENVSAYLYYFLPWNLIRFLSILKNLPLYEPVVKNGHIPLLYDVAAGPLTLSVALWIAKQNWRHLPVKIFARDKIRKPLELGKKLLCCLANKSNAKPWEVIISTGSVFSLPEVAKNNSELKNTYPFLVGAANILNELELPPAFVKHRPLSFEEVLEQSGDEIGKDQEIYYALLYSWSELWKCQSPQLLFLEPGTRLGGSALMQLRKAGRIFDLMPKSPCSHTAKCPFLANSHQSSVLYQKRWCHFTFPSDDAPLWLKDLSARSGLSKRSLSLSVLLFDVGCRKTHATAKTQFARIMTGSFKVPQLRGKCRYACSSQGMLLLEDADKLGAGELVKVEFPEYPERDQKSGAIMISAHGGKEKKVNLQDKGRIKI